MTSETDIAIVGGGLAGPCLALALAQQGLACTIVDALPLDRRVDPAFDGRSYALALASVRMLNALGLWDQVRARAQPMAQIKVTDGRVGDSSVFLGLHFASDEIEEGPMGWMLEDRHLRQTMLNAVESHPAIRHMPGTRVTGQEVSATGVTLTCDTGETLRSRLVIGADGRGSGTAARAAISRTGWRYGQTALVCAIAHSLPHHGIAHQLFLPSGPLAILPLPGNRSSIVWSEKDDLARAIHDLPDADYLSVLRPRFGDFLGEISLAGDRFAYPLGLSLARSFVAPRLALVGDAAHGIHPIAGQGLNAGLRDVAALAQTLTEAQIRGEDIAAPDVLDRYALWRRFDTALLAASTDLFNRLFSNDNTLLRGARDLGMGLINAVPGMRRSAIREAAGLSGELPELMRG